MSKIKKYLTSQIGRSFVTNEGYTATIVDGGSKRDRVMIIIDGNIFSVSFSNLVNGTVKNPFHKSVCGVGFVGVGKYLRRTHKDAYAKWSSILHRCYYQEYIDKQPTYRDVTVCEEWHNFQNFAKWYYLKYPRSGDFPEIDKDLKSGHKKEYSPSTCIFVTKKLNSFMSNNYKNNTSGCIGVDFYKPRGTWRARIEIDGKRNILDILSQEMTLVLRIGKQGVLKQEDGEHFILLIMKKMLSKT